jgi:hypothetical protein
MISLLTKFFMPVTGTLLVIVVTLKFKCLVKTSQAKTMLFHSLQKCFNKVLNFSKTFYHISFVYSEVSVATLISFSDLHSYS